MLYKLLQKQVDLFEIKKIQAEHLFFKPNN